MSSERQGFLSCVKPRSRFFLGPMAEFTNPAMRKVCVQQGAGFVYTEMADAAKLIAGDPVTRKLVSYLAGEHPIAAQIIAAGPEQAARAAVEIQERGFDVVDLNAGCAIRRIVAKGMGADLLRDLDRLGGIVRAMVQAVEIPVTVKLRIGFEEGTVVAPQAGGVCQEAGASAVGVHGRSAQAGYRGPADWAAIAAVKRAVSIPVFGSGDVRTAADAVRMRAQTGCDAVLVARGALGNPWIFRDACHLAAGGSAAQLRKPTRSEVLGVMREHYRLLVAHAGRRKANLLFRRLGGYYCARLADGAGLKTRIQESRSDQDLAKLLRGGA